MATKKTTNEESSNPVFAVIELAGHQYLVKSGDKIKTEKLPAEVGSKITVDQVLLVHSADKTLVGQPFVDGATVELTLDKTEKGEKLRVAKFRAKSRYRRVMGHRQFESYLTVTDVKVK